MNEIFWRHNPIKRHDPEFIQSSTIHIKAMPLLRNVSIQLIDTPHILGKVQCQIKEVCRSIEPCLLNGTKSMVT